MVGDPPFVWIDTDRWKIVFDPTDETLLDNTYQVYITKHILTNKKVQETFFKFIKPFDVTVVGELPEDLTPNNAPKLEKHIEQLTLEPGKTETVVLGKPWDIEGDAFYLKNWKIVEGIVIPWVTLNADLFQTALSVTFAPPEDVKAMKFTLEFKLADRNKRDPKSESYSTSVTVNGESFAFDFRK